MIDKQYGKFMLVCDNCGQLLAGYETHVHAVKALKDLGWEINFNADTNTWFDCCPDCASMY